MPKAMSIIMNILYLRQGVRLSLSRQSMLG
jgi:hypothetical protein